MSALDAQCAALRARLSNAASLGQGGINDAANFAIAANNAGRADLTIALLTPLVDRAPQTAIFWQLLGLALRDEQDMEQASAAFERAAVLAPQDARIALGKAQIAYEMGRPSAHLFKAVRAVAPQDGELALSTAAALFNERKGDTARKIITELLQREPAWLRGLEALSSMRWMAGDRDSYDCDFADAVMARPQDFALRLGWYRAVSQVANWTKAERIIADARRDFGARVELDAIEAYVATEKGEDDRAERLFAASAGLDDPGTKVSNIRHCLRTGRIEQAEQIGLPMTAGPAAATVWPYMSLIWRLKKDEWAQWLDGDPPFIRQFDLGLSDDALASLTETLRALHLTTHHPPEQSLRGGTQTQGHLFLRQEPALRAVRAAIHAAVADYVAGLPPYVEGHPLLGTPRGALHFEGAWSVRLAAQGFHVVHTHPLGWISSAFYVALPETMGTGQAGWLQLGAPPPDLRLSLPAYAEIEPKPGRLALFPSTMWHGTIPFDDGERLTIAFDMRMPRR